MTDGVNGPGVEAPDNRTLVEAGADNGSSGAADWLAGLEADNRSLVEAKCWKGPQDAIKSYRELETRLGQTLPVPGKDATPEEWTKHYDKLGRPPTTTDYALRD